MRSRHSNRSTRRLLLIPFVVLAAGCKVWTSVPPETLSTYVEAETPDRLQIRMRDSDEWVVWAPRVERDTLLGFASRKRGSVDRASSELLIPVDEIESYRKKAVSPVKTVLVLACLMASLVPN